MSSVPQSLAGVRNIIVVLSGKGGVGKSTVACQLALALAYHYKKRVGILDVDICGPSVPKICGVENRDVIRSEQGWLPIDVAPHDGENSGLPDADGQGGGSLKVMSIAFLLPSENDAVVWRGPKKDAMIKQFVTDVCWGDLDYLIVDTPPGTSDEHLTLCELLAGYRATGAVIVTTPQDVSTDDVKKELSFCHKASLRCLGIVENMSGFVCPHCAHCTDIFSRGGGKRLAELYEVAFLGSIPIDPSLCIAEDQGRAFVPPADHSSASGVAPEDGETVAAVVGVIENVVAEVDRAAALAQ